VALGSITYGLILAGEDGWTARGPLIWFAVGVVALVAFVLIERRSDRAALDLSLFRRPAFAGTMLAGMVMSFSAFGYGIYLSVWLQSIVRMTAIGAGLALIPMSIAALVVGGISGRLLHGVSVRLPIAGGLVLIGVGALMQAVLDGDSTWVAVLPGLAVSGAGVGLLSPTLPAAVMAAVPHERGGMASGALNTFRQLGMALGIAVLGTVVRGHGDFIGGLNVALIVAGVAGLVGGAVVLPLFQSPSKAGGRELTQPVRAS
jgi:predicted MFS family arabinose efflux permease